MAWFDSIANSSLLIRIFAVAAELSFSGLFVLGMLQLEKDLPSARTYDKSSFKSFLTRKSPYVLWISLFLMQAPRILPKEKHGIKISQADA